MKRFHLGGPVAKYEVGDARTVGTRTGGARTGASAATNSKRPLAQCEQRARSTCATRNIKSATDLITAGTGAGTSSKARQAFIKPAIRVLLAAVLLPAALLSNPKTVGTSGSSALD